MANLFMAKREEDVFYTGPRPELRYIDDILLIWDGEQSGLDDFMAFLNSNDRGILLQHESSRSEIHFLDLKIKVQDGAIVTSTFFKEMNRNDLICTKSCQHPAWLRSVLVRPFLQLMRNCTRSEDFVQEAPALKLNQAIDRTVKKNKEELLVLRQVVPNDTYKHAFFTTFSTQQYAIKNILQKHWNLLRNDRVLGSLLPETLAVVFRGVLPHRVQVSPNVIDPPKRISFFHNMFFFPCRKCSICQIIAERRKIDSYVSNHTGEHFSIKPFITCTTKHVVYVIRCPCGLEYIGRTIRQLQVRLKEHVTNIKNRYPKHSIIMLSITIEV